MAAKSPQTNYFAIGKKYRTAYTFVLFASFIFTIIFKYINANIAVSVIAIASLIALIVIERARDYYIDLAEETRRRDFIDRSFGTKYCHVSSEGYYDTEELESGMYKMVANVFENSLFSSEISKKMLSKNMAINISLLVILLASIITSTVKIDYAVLLLQVFIGKDFVMGMIDLKKYNESTTETFNDIKKIFDNNLENTAESISKNTPEILRIYLKYETNITDKKLLLDSKIYGAMNEPLSNDWEEMKKKYNIK